MHTKNTVPRTSAHVLTFDPIYWSSSSRSPSCKFRPSQTAFHSLHGFFGFYGSLHKSPLSFSAYITVECKQ